MKGKVKMFNTARDFGFITGEDGKDVYVHKSAIEGGVALATGDAVEYGGMFDSIALALRKPAFE
ncbi:MAG: cold shock domain-containing protein [Candidatus Micrarchaeota archaeon]|nr:cold shock domain-containing protein [Candidatus Micrarchaeota archaeon]